jgi:CheY-like chemotaxis protein
MNGDNHTRPVRILVVDDNAEAAESLKEFLEEVGYDVRSATQASAALAVARTFLPDVAILDIELGVISGYELGQHLHGIRELGGCVLIAATGYNQQDTPARSSQAGFEYHLVKPIDLKRLQQILRELATRLSDSPARGTPPRPASGNPPTS